MSSLTLKQFVAPLLQAFDLSVASGECVCISGPSGCGKTRLLRALANLDPFQGEAFIDTTSAYDLSGPAWRRRVGLLLAESHWWDETLGKHFITLEDGLFSQLGFNDDIRDWQVSRLSSGEKQRLALIRLLQNRPGFLLLDEPTANLDQENARRVEEILQHWRQEQDCGMIWVSHDPAQRARVGQRRFLIENGCLRETS
jgi:ABC-type iron transport system FetAB ATPase subunit